MPRMKPPRRSRRLRYPALEPDAVVIKRRVKTQKQVLHENPSSANELSPSAKVSTRSKRKQDIPALLNPPTLGVVTRAKGLRQGKSIQDKLTQVAAVAVRVAATKYRQRDEEQRENEGVPQAVFAGSPATAASAPRRGPSSPVLDRQIPEQPSSTSLLSPARRSARLPRPTTKFLENIEVQSTYGSRRKVSPSKTSSPSKTPSPAKKKRKPDEPTTPVVITPEPVPTPPRKVVPKLKKNLKKKAKPVAASHLPNPVIPYLYSLQNSGQKFRKTRSVKPVSKKAVDPYAFEGSHAGSRAVSADRPEEETLEDDVVLDRILEITPRKESAVKVTSEKTPSHLVTPLQAREKTKAMGECLLSSLLKATPIKGIPGCDKNVVSWADWFSQSESQEPSQEPAVSEAGSQYTGRKSRRSVRLIEIDAHSGLSFVEFTPAKERRSRGRDSAFTSVAPLSLVDNRSPPPEFSRQTSTDQLDEAASFSAANHSKTHDLLQRKSSRTSLISEDSWHSARESLSHESSGVRSPRENCLERWDSGGESSGTPARPRSPTEASPSSLPTEEAAGPSNIPAEVTEQRSLDEAEPIPAATSSSADESTSGSSRAEGLMLEVTVKSAEPRPLAESPTPSASAPLPFIFDMDTVDLPTDLSRDTQTNSLPQRPYVTDAQLESPVIKILKYDRQQHRLLVDLGNSKTTVVPYEKMKGNTYYRVLLVDFLSRAYAHRTRHIRDTPGNGAADQ